MGNYEFGKTPDDPMILHMCYVPWMQDHEGAEQWRAGRYEMLSMPYQSYEDRVLAQLDQALGHAGFEAERDIEAITVNRWPHGYTYNPSLVWEQEYATDADKPWVKGRKTFGNIAIANCDANAGSNTKSAIDMAYRAAMEIV
jgi:spermidine dehydrogenase